MSDDFFFDPRGVKRDSPAEIIPEGQYIAIIDKVNRKDGENVIGLKIYFKIAIGPYADAVKMDYFNITHYNSEAQRIGRQIFSSLLDCIGMGNEPLKQYSDIENKYIKIEVETVPHYKNFGEKQNKIKRYYALNPVDLNLIKDLPQPEKREADSGYVDIPF